MMMMMNTDHEQPMVVMRTLQAYIDEFSAVMQRLCLLAASAAISACPLQPAAADTAAAAAGAGLTAMVQAVAPTGLQHCSTQLHHLCRALEDASQLVQCAVSLSESPGTSCGYTVRSTPWDGNKLAHGVASVLAELLAAPSAKQRLWVLIDSWVLGAEEPMRLKEVGEEIVTQLPMRYSCNNPRCAVMTGPSEAKLVGGKGCVCSGCKTARWVLCGSSCCAQSCD
jgi:hypothetical protein